MISRVLNLFRKDSPNEDEDMMDEQGDNENGTENEGESEEDKIREARLARFAAMNASSNTPPQTSTSSTTPTKEPVVAKVTSSVPVTTQVTVPRSQTIPVASPTKATTPKSPIKSPMKSPSNRGPTKSFIHIEILKIFSVCLEPEQQTETVFYVPHIAHLLESEAYENLSIRHIDQVLVEVLSRQKRVSNFEYLLGCFSESHAEARLKNNQAEKKKQILEIQEIILRYTGIVLENDIFTEKNTFNNSEEFLKRLCNDSLPASFLNVFIPQISKNPEQLFQIFVPVINILQKQIRSMSLVNEVDEITSGLSKLLSFNELIDPIVNMPSWLIAPSANGQQVETQTFLGPFFAIGAYDLKINRVHQEYFSDFAAMSPQQISTIVQTLREKSRNLIVCLHQGLFSIVRNSREHGKERVLQWVALALHSNQSAAKMRHDPAQVSGPSFRLNLANVLLQFCLPFISKNEFLTKIEGSYLQSGIRLNVDNETRLAVISDLPAWVDKNNQDNIETWKKANPNISINESDLKKIDKAGFTTECFFLTLRAFHLGFVQVRKQHAELLKEYGNIQRRVSSMKKAGKDESDPQMKRLKEISNLIRARIQCIGVHLLDPDFLTQSANFFVFVSKWLVTLVDPQGKGLPLSNPRVDFATLPEFVLDDIAEFFIFFMLNAPSSVSRVCVTELIPMIVLLVDSPTHVRNPYIRARLVKIITEIIEDTERQHSNLIYDVLDSDEVVRKNLAGVLMRFYVQIENTGGHGQFFEKFSVRRDIQVIFKHMWLTPSHCKQIIRESEKEDEFLPFISKILNDAVYLLDDALEKLKEIRNTQIEMADTASWSQKENREELETQFERDENVVRSDLFYAYETVNMLLYLSDQIVQPFMRPELVGRIANMLNYYLVVLAGPKSSDLMVKEKEKYNFKPRELLGQLVDIYLHFWTPEFIQAVGRDGRSYDDAIFTSVADIIRRTNIRSEHTASKFLEFAREVKSSLPTEDDDIEVPDEFLDPMLCEIMNDPVRLPSGHVVELAVIRQHFLSSGETNPYNRQPLTEKDLVPDTELKARIEQWKKENNYRG